MESRREQGKTARRLKRQMEGDMDVEGNPEMERMGDEVPVHAWPSSHWSTTMTMTISTDEERPQ
ncbi:hypothetical protein GQ600_9674 [Phytophthora cactorum]|nr:hypothetical protein GQ600_9674 [Phytophthora cactorum]